MKVVNTIAQANLSAFWKCKVRVWDFEFLAPSLDRLAALLLHKFGLLGKRERLFFEQKLKPGMTVIDIGANQGLYSLMFSRLVGETGAVIAFEPEPDMFAALETNVSANSSKNLECHRLALGSKSGEAMISRSLINGGDNRLGSGHSDTTSMKKPVTIVTLDEIVGNRKIDFIKMDVQGWEGEAIRGMEATLQRNPTIGLYFEFWPAGLWRSGWEPLDLLQLISQQGFQIHWRRDDQEMLLHDFPLFLNQLSQGQFVNLYAQRG
jgi:FkbM family methyltransferase